jgi:hypothetical protein
MFLPPAKQKILKQFGDGWAREKGLCRWWTAGLETGGEGKRLWGFWG